MMQEADSPSLKIHEVLWEQNQECILGSPGILTYINDGYVYIVAEVQKALVWWRSIDLIAPTFTSHDIPSDFI